MTQSTALAMLQSGSNVFLTGEPGSGKTHTVNRYVAWLRRHGIEPAITASTGIAATHLGGMTVHAWAGIGIEKRASEELIDRIMANSRSKKRITGARILIIDEISMLDARTVTVVETVCRAVKGNNLPFGGMQVVFVGDFFQLPPVQSPDDGEDGPPQFAFESPAWHRAAPAVCYLTEQYRQDDREFLELLGAIRHGDITDRVREILRSRRGDHAEDSISVRLYAHNANVDSVNHRRLSELPGDANAFDMSSEGPGKLVARLAGSCLSPESLQLKIGARVMFTKNNFEKGFVNGTLGDVVGFDEDGLPIVRTAGGRTIHAAPMDWIISDGIKTLAKVTQIPLRLAWAITIHKSQGLTLDAAVMDLSQVFEFGQGYVALSRVRSLSGLFLLGFNERALRVHPAIREADEQFASQSEHADARFECLPEEKRASLRDAFIRVCGGTLEEQTPAPVGRKKIKKEKKPSTYAQTLALFKEGKTVRDIAEARSFAPSTIHSHLEKLLADGNINKEEILRILPSRLADALPEIRTAFERSEEMRLTPVFEACRGKFSFEELRLVRMVL
jgi:ATP-dependent DNA helicase PIF1